jgi:hypothetical protein
MESNIIFYAALCMDVKGEVRIRLLASSGRDLGVQGTERAQEHREASSLYEPFVS